ncbi:UDP-3-O-(3-hydroxymyristoyl)glucosamine N-acyltransferase [Candidatus Kapaibacterium sp.]
MINFTVNQIAEIIQGEIIGSTDSSIFSFKPLETAEKGDLTFYYNEKYEQLFKNSQATCIIVSKTNESSPSTNQVYIKVDKPYEGFVKLLKIIDKEKKIGRCGVHASAVIGKNVTIHENVFVAPNCVIGDNCILKSGVELMPSVILYESVEIGNNSVINSNVTIYQEVKIGNNCIVHAGAVIGSDGFGYIENKFDGSFDKVPQLGNVILEDFVEIGANATIDRALIGSTIIRKGTKIDNLVHIAHNCEIGENNGIAAQTGISGSVSTGKRNRYGGQVGIAGHLEIADDVTILAQSGISKTIPNKGIYFGSPAKEHLKAFKIEAVLRRLPELNSEVERNSKEIIKLKEKIGD